MAVVLLITEYTDMSMSQVIQRQIIHYSGGLSVLRHLLTQVAGNVEAVDDKKL
jgi:cleavage and polyadenylation specificity factor subunit 3